MKRGGSHRLPAIPARGDLPAEDRPRRSTVRGGDRKIGRTAACCSFTCIARAAVGAVRARPPPICRRRGRGQLQGNPARRRGQRGLTWRTSRPSREFNHPDAVLVHAPAARQAHGQVRRGGEEAPRRCRRTQFRPDTSARTRSPRSSPTTAPDDATTLLLEKKKKRTWRRLLSEILIARMKYKDALGLIGTGKTEKEAIGVAERRDFNLRAPRPRTHAHR